MKMYRLKNSGIFCRTKAEVTSHKMNPFGEEWEKIDVPTDQKGLVDYLNQVNGKWASRAYDAETKLALMDVEI